jgi:hypothetical protein
VFVLSSTYTALQTQSKNAGKPRFASIGQS